MYIRKLRLIFIGFLFCCYLFPVSTFAIAPSAELPVELLYFNPIIEDKVIYLKWATITEINNSHFEIEHSTNGLDFIKIENIEGAGNSFSALEYNYTHHDSSPGINYYRLKLVDYNGDFEYSPVEKIALRLLQSTFLTLFPNVSSDQIRLNFLNENQSEKIHLKVFDTIGRNIYDLEIPGNTNRYNLKVDAIPAGYYIVQVKLGKTLLVERFLKPRK